MAGRLKRRSSLFTGINRTQSSEETPARHDSTNSHRGNNETLNDSIPVLERSEVAEEDERRERRRVQKRQSMGASLVNAGASSVSAGLSIAQLSEHYSNCMKLSAENKISVKNAFNLHMIDNMAEMMRRKHSDLDNFQAASCALDASAKIYAYRVDSVHSDTLKLAGGVGSTVNKNDKENNQNDQGMDQDGDNEDAEKKKKKKRIRATVEKNLKNITNTKFELEFDVDPLFKKTSAQFDSGGGGGQFLSGLYISGENSELLLDSNAYLPTGFDYAKEIGEQEKEEMINVMELLPPKFDAANLICPTFSTFGFKEWSPESEEKMDLSLSQKNDEEKPEEDHVFDPAALNNDMDDMDNDFISHDAVGFDNDDVMDVDKNEGELQRGTVGLALKVMDIQNMKEHLAYVPSEYSYFDTGRLGAWAGPKHWKFKPVSRKQGELTEEEKKKRSKRREKERMTFEDLDDDSKDTLEVVEKFMKVPKKVLQYKDETLKNWSEEKATLPEDLHYRGKDFVHLKSLSHLNVAPGAVKDSQSVDDTINEYDFDNQIDAEGFCPANVDDIGADVNEYDDDNDGFSNVFSQSASIIPQSENNETLVDAPNKVEKIHIGYAKQAKKMDMRKLKVIEWSILRTAAEDKENVTQNQETPAPTADKTKTPNLDDTMNNAVTFKTLYNGLSEPQKLPTKMLENLSVPLAFVALLHLCNEKNLQLQENEELTDFTIMQG